MSLVRIVKLLCVMMVSMLITRMGYGMNTVEFWVIIGLCTIIGLPIQE